MTIAFIKNYYYNNNGFKADLISDASVPIIREKRKKGGAEALNNKMRSARKEKKMNAVLKRGMVVVTGAADQR